MVARSRLPTIYERNQLRFGVHRDEHPSVAELLRVIDFNVAIFLRDEAPNFVGLNPLTLQVPHLRLHQCYAALTSKHQKPQNRIAVQLRDALYRADGRSFNEKLNRQQSLIFRHRHRREKVRMLFGVGLAADRAAEPL